MSCQAMNVEDEVKGLNKKMHLHSVALYHIMDCNLINFS